MADYFAEKRHDPTPRRRQRARAEGHVARSQDLASAILLIAGLLVLFWKGGAIVDRCGNAMVDQLSGRGWLSDNQGKIGGAAEAVQQLRSLAFQTLTLLLPLLTLLLLAAVAANVGQFGFLFVPGKLAPDVGRVSPWQGVRRIWSANNAVRLGFGILKIVAITAICLGALWADRHKILGLTNGSAGAIGSFMATLALWTSLKVAAALMLLALIDYVYQRWRHEQELRMTDQELREEMRALQGDPQLLARRRRLQQQLAASRQVP